MGLPNVPGFISTKLSQQADIMNKIENTSPALMAIDK